MSEPYTLDDAHEALAMADLWLRQPYHLEPESLMAWAAVAEALDAIEAQLPEPCSNCGDDSCLSPGECLVHITWHFGVA